MADTWRCPRCGAGFVTKNMWHSCVRLGLGELFGERVKARRLFDAYLRFARRVGPFEVVPQKTGIVFVAKTRFAGVQRIGNEHLMIGFGLPRQITSARIEKVEHILRWYVHRIRLTDPAQLDDELLDWLKESYQQMGLRRYLDKRP